MAKREVVTISKSDIGTLSLVSKMKPADMVGMDTNVGFDASLLPNEFKGITFEVVQTGFNPSAVWNNPGDFVAGIYTGKEEQVGPNNAMLYNFETKAGKPFSVWGCTVLDRAFKQSEDAGLIVPGRVVMIMFAGTTPSKFEANPVKLFQIGVAKVAQ